MKYYKMEDEPVYTKSQMDKINGEPVELKPFEKIQINSELIEAKSDYVHYAQYYLSKYTIGESGKSDLLIAMQLILKELAKDE